MKEALAFIKVFKLIIRLCKKEKICNIWRTPIPSANILTQDPRYPKSGYKNLCWRQERDTATKKHKNYDQTEYNQQLMEQNEGTWSETLLPSHTRTRTRTRVSE